MFALAAGDGNLPLGSFMASVGGTRIMKSCVSFSLFCAVFLTELVNLSSFLALLRSWFVSVYCALNSTLLCLFEVRLACNSW